MRNDHCACPHLLREASLTDVDLRPLSPHLATLAGPLRFLLLTIIYGHTAVAANVITSTTTGEIESFRSVEGENRFRLPDAVLHTALEVEERAHCEAPFLPRVTLLQLVDLDRLVLLHGVLHHGQGDPLHGSQRSVLPRHVSAELLDAAQALDPREHVAVLVEVPVAEVRVPWPLTATVMWQWDFCSCIETQLCVEVHVTTPLTPPPITGFSVFPNPIHPRPLYHKTQTAQETPVCDSDRTRRFMMDIVNRLPPELQLRALGVCARGDLFSMSLVSRQFYHVCTPVLYHTIDLSSHNGDYIDFMGGWGKLKVPPDWLDRFHCQDLDGALYKRQLGFLRTLQAKPGFARHARELHWTTVRMPCKVEENELALHLQPSAVELEEGCWGWSENQLYFQLRREFDFNNCNSYLWGKLALMVHLKVVDIAFVDTDNREADPPPRGLFSSALSVRLTGMASRCLIKSPLGSVEPTGLRHLYLNNITEFAELSGIREGRTLREKKEDTTLSLNNQQPSWTNADPSEPVSWQMVKFGNIGDRHYWGANAAQLSAAPRGGQPTVPYPDGVRPMDSRFQRHILPAITESTWPKLLRLELFGVADYTYRPGKEPRVLNVPLSDADQDNIRSAVGDSVALDIRADATRYFWIGENGDETGIQELPDEEDTESDSDGDDASQAEDGDD
ncbi:hypothetical protein PG993_010966 [Apiospora rasikravindrae]|uniref:F-box domain-containing protein n=1 Tax=Apiospora rasikravindrae TaxID=990691 RepID=A0ABR1SCT7_9PEZI